MLLVQSNQLLDQAINHHAEGRHREAEQLYRDVLAEQPNSAAARHGLGVIALQSGRHAEAIAWITQAVKLEPRVAMYQSNLGEAFRGAGRLPEAIVHLRKALSLRPDLPSALNNLGLALRQSGQTKAALECFRQAIQIAPNYGQALSNLGLTLQDLKQTDESVQVLRRAVEVEPSMALAHYNLANVLTEKKEFDAAMSSYRRAIELQPDYAEAHNNLAAAYDQLDLIDHAIECYRQVIQLRPDWLEARCNLSIALQMAGRLAEAIEVAEKAVSVKPDASAPNWNWGLLRLTDGDFENGWRGYEWRFAQQKAAPPEPAWDGSDPSGQTILVHAEQGFGDTLQFIRYAPLLTQRGAKVVVECQAELTSLLKRVEGVGTVISRGEPLPNPDRRVALMSLPLHFKTTLETIPAQIPYLKVDEEKLTQWRNRLASYTDGLKVGIVWAGRPTHTNDRRRSLSLANFSPLFGIPGIQLFSLQKGDAAGQTRRPPRGANLIDLTDELRDFDDTAAFVSCLDLVIAPDTAVVHLAGGLGKEAWTVLPFCGDWRWMRNREDSPWYPTVRLFRQSKLGQWSDVMERVAHTLRERIRAGEPSAPPSTESPLVIIPHYRKPEQLKRCLQALSEQSSPATPWVHDNSTQNFGFTKAVNLGLKTALARGDYYAAILNQDCYLQPNAIEQMIQFMEAHPACAIAGIKQISADDPDLIVHGGCTAAYPEGKHIGGRQSKGECARSRQMPWVNGACLIVRLDAVREFGLMDENFGLIGSDSDWCYTARARGWEVWYCSEAECLHESGVTRDIERSATSHQQMGRDIQYWGDKWLGSKLYARLSQQR